MSEPRILFFDIESTGLNATFGTILCIGYKWLGNPKVHVPTILDYSKSNFLDDRGLVREFAKVYEGADYTVGHYASRFDVPMIQSKLLRYNLPPLAPIPLIDTWRVARDTFKFHNNRLATIQGFLGLTHEKTPISFDHWLQAAHGNKKALRQVVEHCRLDVLVLEEAFVKLRPWIKNEPSRRLFSDHGSCISCGSEALQARGFAIAKTRKYQRYQCTSCGKWQRDNKAANNKLELV